MVDVNKTTLLRQLVYDYEYFYETLKFADFDIVINDVVIKAHKVVLCARNKVFADMLRANDQVRKVELSDVDPEAFKVFIKYLYTSKLRKNDISPNLLLIAKKYLDVNLKEFCENYLYENSIFQEKLFEEQRMCLNMLKKDSRKEVSGFFNGRFYIKISSRDASVSESFRILDVLWKYEINYNKSNDTLFIKLICEDANKNPRLVFNVTNEVRLISSISRDKDVTMRHHNKFTREKSCWGWYILAWNKLLDKGNGYIVNEKIELEANVTMVIEEK